MASFSLTKIVVLLFALSCNSLAEQIDRSDLVEKAIQGAEEKYALEEKQFPGKSQKNLKTTEFSREQSKQTFVFKFAEDDLVNSHGFDREDARAQLQGKKELEVRQFAQNCGFTKFRTIDGTCNNLRNRRWGAKDIPLNRIAASAYDDGRSAPRGGLAANRLPNARWQSINIHPDSSDLNRFVTNMVPQFGQFLDHDITLSTSQNLQCCQGSNHPDCWSIAISSRDPFYSQHGQRCMDFTRSTAFSQSFPREQINGITSFIDASQVYGSDPQRSAALRLFRGGRLKTQTALTGFLPIGREIGVEVEGTFAAGDERVNEMPALTVMHNLFLMEHNRIADEFSRLTNWNDERIYQETRRIVGAELQNVAYREYLPLVLGDSGMRQNDLTVPRGYSQYNPSINPSIFNSFATAAYRFGHSMVPGLVRLISNNNQEVGRYSIRNEYFQGRQMTQANGQGYDWILRGLMSSNSPEFDPFVTTGVTNFLFKPQNRNFGADLIARNIQRGRDHGIPGYNTYRRLCGLAGITSWFQRPREIRADAWDELVKLYNNWDSRLTPNDIDLFTGGLVEIPVSDGIVGPTFQCLIGAQFARLKFGDRFYFTHGGQSGSFTDGQLNQIKARTLGDIICANSQQPSTNRNVFLVPSSSNPFVPCNDRSRGRLDLKAFI